MEDEYSPIRCYLTYGGKRCSHCDNKDKYAIFSRIVKTHKKILKAYLHIVDSINEEHDTDCQVEYLCQDCFYNKYDLAVESEPGHTDFIVTKKLPHRNSKKAYQ
jgi:hypothetical protein